MSTRATFTQAAVRRKSGSFTIYSSGRAMGKVCHFLKWGSHFLRNLHARNFATNAVWLLLKPLCYGCCEQFSLCDRLVFGPGNVRAVSHSEILESFLWGD